MRGSVFATCAARRSWRPDFGRRLGGTSKSSLPQSAGVCASSSKMATGEDSGQLQVRRRPRAPGARPIPTGRERLAQKPAGENGSCSQSWRDSGGQALRVRSICPRRPPIVTRQPRICWVAEPPFLSPDHMYQTPSPRLVAAAAGRTPATSRGHRPPASGGSCRLNSQDFDALKDRLRKETPTSVVGSGP
jgi:hypothetical protein